MIKCKNCGSDNRDEALYCKDCGSKIEPVQCNEATVVKTSEKSDVLDDIVGLDEYKRLIREKVRQYKILHSLTIRDKVIPVYFDMIIVGPTGSGKSAFVNAVTKYLYDNKIITQQYPTVISQPDKAELWDFYEEAKGGVLCIDNVDREIPKKEEQYNDVILYENIVKSLGDSGAHISNRPIVILTGNENLKKYLAHHSLYNTNFTFKFDFPSSSLSDLVEITKRRLENDYGMKWSKEALEKLKNIYAAMKRDTTVPFGNGHTVTKKSLEIMQEFALKETSSRSSLLLPEHIPGREFKPKTFDEIIKEFDKYVGIDEIKESLKGIAAYIENERREKKDGDTAPILKDHFLFLGNPGTGKTTMARLFADALTAMGVLSVGQLVEVSRKDLVGQWLGSTAPLVEDAFNRAEGGVLFIDEAYDLKNDEKDSFGQEAVNTLIKLAEDRRGRVVVILAGYTREMGIFKDSNPGIKSRFNISVNFRDYNAEELEEIFRRLVKANGYLLDESAEKGLPSFFKTMYLKRLKDFGNAREVRNVFDAAVKRYSSRMMNEPEDGADTFKERYLTMSDIEDDSKRQKSVDEVLDSLDDLIGMENVKEQIRSIANSIKGARRRMKTGLGKDDLQNIHIVITGNPGTGKTTVAKRLGEIFKSLGVLSSDKVVERDRSNLVTSLVNSGANNMNAAVEEAMGGILFIDEAYNLYNPQDSTGDKPGLEAVEALMKRMSDDAGKFVTIIAGYKDRIDWFINNANPGLKRRFTYRVNIDDYTAAQLMEIFLKTAGSRNYKLTESAKRKAWEKINRLVAEKDENFGNAGVIINFFNKTLERQSDRLSPYFDDENVADDIFFQIEAEDIPFDFIQ